MDGQLEQVWEASQSQAVPGPHGTESQYSPVGTISTGTEWDNVQSTQTGSGSLKYNEAVQSLV